jgi:hypothetical protein
MAEFSRGLAMGAIAAAFCVAPFLAGCSEGTDVEINAPLLDAAGVKLMTNDSKKAENLPERAPLVMPPSNELPAPGRAQAAQVAEAKLPNDPDQAKKNAAEKKKADREKYCKDGDWSGKGGIGEFDKATGKEQRCPSKWGDALNKTFSNTSQSSSENPSGQ